MIREAIHWGLMGVGAAGAALAIAFVSNAQPPQYSGGQNGPGYQRHASDSSWRGHDRRRNDRYRQPYGPVMPQVQSNYFQRPYPYHLDYYKMRYGGSYAPYFGNLYGTPFGTPQVVYGGDGYGGAGGPWNGGPQPGYPAGDVNGYPPGAMMEQPQQMQPQSNGVISNTPAGSTATKLDSSATESLPPPTK